jgi:acyl dehydratase
VLTRPGDLGILAGVTDLPERPARYFEDYAPGFTVDCGSVPISEAEIIAFAKEYDPQPFHVDPVAAADGPFGGLIASGWHTGSVAMRQLVNHWISQESSLGSPGAEEMRWPSPVRPGDTLHVRATVLEARRSKSRPDRGIIRSLTEVTNQNGDTVLRLIATNFILARHPEG